MSDMRRAYDLLRGYVGREWERIVGPERDQAFDELYAPPSTPTAPSSVPEPPKEDQLREARRVLGVADDADLAAIDHAYGKLEERSHPRNFPEGSEAREQAKQIHERVRWAYGKLTENLDPSQRRFRSLELE